MSAFIAFEYYTCVSRDCAFDAVEHNLTVCKFSCISFNASGNSECYGSIDSSVTSSRDANRELVNSFNVPVGVVASESTIAVYHALICEVVVHPSTYSCCCATSLKRHRTQLAGVGRDSPSARIAQCTNFACLVNIVTIVIAQEFVAVKVEDCSSLVVIREGSHRHLCASVGSYCIGAACATLEAVVLVRFDSVSCGDSSLGSNKSGVGCFHCCKICTCFGSSGSGNSIFAIRNSGLQFFKRHISVDLTRVGTDSVVSNCSRGRNTWDDRTQRGAASFIVINLNELPCWSSVSTAIPCGKSSLSITICLVSAVNRKFRTLNVDVVLTVA